MAETQNKCPKCDGEMIQGFVLDQAHGGGILLLQKWFRGSPKRSFWTGISSPATNGIPLAAFRCAECGFIEFYAHGKYKAV